MRLLVFGGSVFLSFAVATCAHRRGHDVTCAARFRSGRAPVGVRTVRIDRCDSERVAALGQHHFDAVIDVASQPRWVKQALDVLGAGTTHWIYVSSGSVYADQHTRRQRAASAPVRAPSDLDACETAPATYGPRKAACEQLILRNRGSAATIVRPGLIVGSADPTDRFGYWPLRLARGGHVLAPGSPADPVQWLDVRDLAAWLVVLAEDGIAGCFDAVGPAIPRGDFLDQISRAVGTQSTLVWASQEFLLGAGVSPWMGVNSLPLWVPLPDFAGVLDRDPADSQAAGLRQRDLAETTRELLSWYQHTSGIHRLAAGLDAEVERSLLARLGGTSA